MTLPRARDTPPLGTTGERPPIPPEGELPPIPPARELPPIPPADLILRVAPSFDPDGIELNRQAFDAGAIAHLECFERALAGVGRSLGQFDRLLDFGCGCGRFLRHLGPLSDQVEIHGADIDAEMIEWLRANVPYGRYELAPHEPPLSYPDGYFDLIVNHSVFTHLDERMQDLWLGELQRISRPGALLLLTVEGTSSFDRAYQAARETDVGESERWREGLRSRGILFIERDAFIGTTHPDFYHSTFHAPWYVFEHWTRFFDLAAYLPDGSDSQDLVMLRRRENRAPQPPPIARRAAPSVAAMASSLRERWLRSRTRAVDSAAVTRELEMLRAGLREQANRISVVTAQLREELESVRREASARPERRDS